MGQQCDGVLICALFSTELGGQEPEDPQSSAVHDLY